MNRDVVDDGSGIEADVVPLGDGGGNLDIGDPPDDADGDSAPDTDATPLDDVGGADGDVADGEDDAGACDLAPCATESPCEEAYCDGAVCSVRAVAAGTLCEGARVCDGTGSCVGCESDSDCDDGFSCTVEVCDVTTGTCSRALQDVPCDDGLFCNGVEVCDPAAPRAGSDGCGPGARIDRGDEIACTNDLCIEDTDTVEHVPDDALCDDGNECTVGICSTSVGCEFTPVVAGSMCDAGSGRCSAGSCLDCIDSGEGVDAGCGGARPYCVSGACVACESDDDCLGALTCEGGACAGCTNNEDCNDDVACTVDVCVPETGICENVASNSVCNDGLFCTGVEECRPDSNLAGVDGCAVVSTPTVDDGVACTTDRCDETIGRVVHEPVNALCDDGNPCTSDVCVADEGCDSSVRFGEPLCDDDGVCGPDGTCGECADTTNGFVDEGCDDAAPDCIDAICSLCVAESDDCPLDCAGVPGGGAVRDACGTCDADPANDCLGLCDGEPCGPVCDGSVDGECDDGNPCTDDACVAGRCVWDTAPMDGIECADGSVCTVDTVCSAGECTSGDVLDCDGLCETGVCDPVSGCTREAVGTACDDGSPLTLGEVCRADGACVGVCDDGDPCTIDIPAAVNVVQLCEPPQAMAAGAVIERISACESVVCNGAGEAVATVDPDCASCAAGACSGQCYTGECRDGGGCVASSSGVACDDGDARTTNDVCDGNGGCTGRCPEIECGEWIGFNGSCDFVTEITIGGVTSCEDDGNPCTTEYCDRDGNCARASTASGVSCEHGCGAGVCDGAGSCELRQDECEELLGSCWEDATCDLETETCEGTPLDPYCLEPGAICLQEWGFCRGATETCGDGVCQGSEASSFCGSCAADCSGFDSFGCTRSVNRSSFSAAHQAFASQAYGFVPAYQNTTVTRMLNDGLRWFHQRVDYCEPGATSGPVCVCDANGLCPSTPLPLREPLSELADYMRANPLAVVVVQTESTDVLGADLRAEFEAAGALEFEYRRARRSTGVEPWNLGFATMARKNRRLVVFGPGFISSENLYYATRLRDIDGDSVDGEDGGSGLFDVGDGSLSEVVYECADAFDNLPTGVEEHRPVVLRHSTRTPTASWQLAACYNPQRTDHYLACKDVWEHGIYVIVDAIPMDFYNASTNGTTYHDGENRIYTNRCSANVSGCFDDDDCSSGVCGGIFICLNCANSDDCEDGEWCDTYIGACVPPQTDGGVCVEDAQCESGRCEFFLCQSCSSDSECESDEFCDAFGGCQPKNFNGVGCLTRRECQSDICFGGFCVECDDEADCEASEYCDRNVLPGESACTPRLDIGSTCSTDFVCASGNCHALTCSECDEQSDCESDEFCTLDLVPPIESVCQLRGEEGEGCASNLECISGSCFGFVCVDTCSNDTDCGDGRWCDGVGVCQDEVPNGNVCLTNVECQSGNCFLGFCVACDEQADCPGTDFCSLDPLPGLSACIVAKDIGAACVENFECATNDCFLGFCVACNEQSDCAAGSFCSLDPLPGASACIAPKAIGEACVQNFECASESCFLGFCVACNEQSDCAGATFCSLDPVPGESACIARKPTGDACVQNFECANDNCFSGFCVACNEQADCGAGTFCSLNPLPGQSACIALKPNGSFCATSVECESSQCTLGQCGECVDDGQCAANEHCDVSNNCAPDVANNAPCLKNSACTTGLCQEGFCAECNADTGTFGCPASQHCNAVNDCANDVGNNAVCLRDSFCTTGICSAGFCAQCRNNSDCNSNQFCDVGGDCVADLPNNAVCTDSSQCSTGICSLGFCAQCTSDAGCASNQHCDAANDCVADVGNNQSCLRNSQCTTGICSLGFCAECTTDANCPASEHCDAANDCVADVGNNEICLRNAQCTTGICSLGFCAECTTDANCPANQNCNAANDCAPDEGNNGPCLRDAQCTTGICVLGACAQCRTASDCSSNQFCNAGLDCENKRPNGSICSNPNECQANCCNFTFICGGLGC